MMTRIKSSWLRSIDADDPDMCTLSGRFEFQSIKIHRRRLEALNFGFLGKKTSERKLSEFWIWFPKLSEAMSLCWVAEFLQSVFFEGHGVSFKSMMFSTHSVCSPGSHHLCRFHFSIDALEPVLLCEMRPTLSFFFFLYCSPPSSCKITFRSLQNPATSMNQL